VGKFSLRHQLIHNQYVALQESTQRVANGLGLLYTIIYNSQLDISIFILSQTACTGKGYYANNDLLQCNEDNVEDGLV